MGSPALLEAQPFTSRWWKHDGVLGEKFQTQAALKMRVRGIVDRAPLGVPLSAPDSAFLVEILRRHHHWRQKQGTGIQSIVVRLNPPPGFGTATRGLWLIRSDGSEVDISWYTPLQRGGMQYAHRGVALAARCEVSDQTRAVYDLLRGTTCPICGKPLRRGHVDHAAPLTFERLLADWLTAEGLSADEVEITDAGVENAFADRHLAARWSEFHRRHAKLRLIHPGENLSAAKLGFTAPDRTQAPHETMMSPGAQQMLF